MNFTPQNLCGFLIRSRLMSADDMRSMSERWQSEAGAAASDLERFTRWLVANKYVTDYQAGLLAKGHGDPDTFFLGPYKVLERIGRGRMAGVYKAVHALGQTVAIKVLPPSRAKDAVLRGRFQREARLSLRLNHPNVVRSFQVGQSGGLHYLVMECLDGETLEDALQRRRRLPPAEAVRIIHQALKGLEHMHELGMVHRDLKPANLMLVPSPAKGEPDITDRATVKILDIGLGRDLFKENETAASDNIELTAEGVIIGTPDYLAPEQARDPRNIDIRADIYSLGCVLYHLLAGQPPFPDKSLIKQMVRHATETPKPLGHFNAAVADGLGQIVGYMMAKQPAQRYPTPERAAQALQMFLMADSPAPRAAAETPQLRTYLTWLETAPEDASPPTPAASEDAGALPVGKPAVGTVQWLPATSTRSTSRRKKHKKQRKQRVPVAEPAPLPAARFDVELVPIPADALGKPASGPAALAAPHKLLGLTVREWLLMGAGAAALAAALSIGLIAAWFMKS